MKKLVCTLEEICKPSKVTQDMFRITTTSMEKLRKFQKDNTFTLNEYTDIPWQWLFICMSFKNDIVVYFPENKSKISFNNGNITYLVDEKDIGCVYKYNGKYNEIDRLLSYFAFYEKLFPRNVFKNNIDLRALLPNPLELIRLIGYTSIENVVYDKIPIYDVFNETCDRTFDIIFVSQKERLNTSNEFLEQLGYIGLDYIATKYRDVCPTRIQFNDKLILKYKPKTLKCIPEIVNLCECRYKIVLTMSITI